MLGGECVLLCILAPADITAARSASPPGRVRVPSGFAGSITACRTDSAAGRGARRQPDGRPWSSSRSGLSALLQERLDENGHGLRGRQCGVSGDTSAGGLRRLDWALEGDVRVLIVALGANDGLRGLPAAQLKQQSVRASSSVRRSAAST